MNIFNYNNLDIFSTIFIAPNYVIVIFLKIDLIITINMLI